MKLRWIHISPALILGTTTLAANVIAAPVKITYAAWGAGSEPIRQVIAEFEQLHPDIVVDTQVVPCCNDKTVEKYLVQIAAGAGPDVMEVPYVAVAAMAKAGALLPLDNFIKADRATVDPDDIFPPAWNAVTVGGVVYGMPYDLSAQWMAYIPDNFVRSGVEDPIAAYESGDWTWDTLRADAKKLTIRNSDGEVTQIGMLAQYGEFLGQPWLYQTGTTPFAEELTRGNFTDPRIVDAVQFVHDMQHVDGSSLPLGGGAASPKAGHFGVWSQWLSIPYYFEDSPFHADIVPAPRGPVGNVDTGQIHSISVWSGSQHPQAAWQFASFLTGKIGYRTIIQDGKAPIRKSLVPDYLEATVQKLGVQGARLFLQDIGRLRTFQVTPDYTKVSGAIYQALDAVWAGKTPPKTALEEIQQQVNAILGDAPREG